MLLNKEEQTQTQDHIRDILQTRTVQVIGGGGIGSWLLLFLGKGSNMHGIGRIRANCFDGDRVERKNLVRQLFSERDIGSNKGSALRERLEDYLDIIEFDEYIDKNNVSLLGEKSLIFMCVDNHVTRKLVSEHCQTLDDVILISGGNELWDGTVQVYVRTNGEDITPPLTYGHPEIEDPQDQPPWSCAEVAESEPQIAATNIMVASHMLSAYWMLSKEIVWHELHFDLLQGKSDSFDFWANSRKKVIAKSVA